MAQRLEVEGRGPAKAGTTNGVLVHGFVFVFTLYRATEGVTDVTHVEVLEVYFCSHYVKVRQKLSVVRQGAPFLHWRDSFGGLADVAH